MSLPPTTTPSYGQNLDRFASFVRQERAVIMSLVIYALMIGILSLIVPLTVQELVNTFAYSVTPLMVVTIVGVMALILLFAGVFRALQFYAMEVLEQRIFVRVSLSLAQMMPRFKRESFKLEIISRFLETDLIQRALANIFIDFVNVLVGGTIAMILLAVYHPLFLIFDVVLVIVTPIFVSVLGRGGLPTTQETARTKYDVYHWFREVGDNLLHCKATNSADIVFKKTDFLTMAYVDARKARFKVLIRQYIGSVLFQITMHASLLGTAGWLLSKGELTLGQLVGSEVVVSGLLFNIDSVVKRMHVMYNFFSSLEQIYRLFSIPKDKGPEDAEMPIPPSDSAGLHLTCQDLRPNAPGHEDINFEVLPGEKFAVICPTESMRHYLSLTLAGLQEPLGGVVRYNGVDLRSVSSDAVSLSRGILFGRELTLFEGSVADNITMGRPGIKPEDLMWSGELMQLEHELQNGLQTMVVEDGKNLTPSQRLRVLLARAIITRPPLLILEGSLHEIETHIREPILRQLRSKQSAWTLIVVTTDPNIKNWITKTLSFL